MNDEPLRVSEAARRLGLTTREVLVLVREDQLPSVMVDGIAHIPTDAIATYRAKVS